ASLSPVGSHQHVTCSGRVHASKTCSRGAASTRVRVIVCASGSITTPVLATDGGMLLLLLAHRLEMAVQIVEPAFPLLAKGLDPVGDIFERRGHQLARSPLRVT